MSLKNKILSLRKKGLSYNSIVKEVGCAKSLVAYYCNNTSKDKAKKIQKKRREKQHPLKKKIENFIYRKDYKSRRHKCSYGWNKALYFKLYSFTNQKNNKIKMKNKPLLTVDEALELFGDEPRCYLTGEKIDLNEPSTYNLDHKVPHTRGGKNTIHNMGLCTAKANSSKNDMTPEEFIEFCKLVVNYNK